MKTCDRCSTEIKRGKYCAKCRADVRKETNARLNAKYNARRKPDSQRKKADSEMILVGGRCPLKMFAEVMR